MNCHRIRPNSWLVVFGCLAAGISHADVVDYQRDVKPLLAERCYACHGALKQEGGLRLDTGKSILRGGDSGAAVRAGQPNASRLLERVSASAATERMPPDEKPLTAAQIEVLRQWIAAGAHAPADEKPAADPRSHWAFQRPVRPTPPAVTGVSSVNPIDCFIGQTLGSRGLEQLPEADRATLLRRVTLDLIGVPPQPEDLASFLADDRDDAYERVVDRLLADPRYGERWGRHWMDVWRYSDWYGRRSVPDVMNSYPHVWRWRDWIVRSLNCGRGYDQMVLAMLAADEVFPGNDDEVVATGFLVRNWFKWNYESWMKDNVEHTGKAFLGLTLNCCQCHDHKYDPITQREYFQFRAFFEPLELRQDRVTGLPDPGPFQKYVYAKSYGPIAAGLIRVFDEKLDAQTFMYAKGDARNRIGGEPPAEPLVPAVLGSESFTVTPVDLEDAAYYPGLKPFIRAEERATAQAAVSAAISGADKARSAANAARQEVADLRASSQQPITAANPQRPESLLPAEIAAVDAQAALELNAAKLASAEAQLAALEARIAADDVKYANGAAVKELAQAASLAERHAAWLAAKANLLAAEQAIVAAERKATTDEEVKKKLPETQKKLDVARTANDAARAALAATSEKYAPLSPVYPSRSSGRRAALARWIASSQNPLTARVAVNHLWMRHFGRGLVETPANFGLSGKTPSHPELLDWLAVEFRETGWEMKHLHRLMVKSRAYRTSSTLGAATHPNLAADPENLTYWRFNPRRMEAEVVRDSVLACAGTLDDTFGGQEIDHAQGLTSRRRSLYFASHGESQMQFLDLFDGPTTTECYERSSSVVPQQALSLANSELVLNQSRSLAAELWRRTESAESRESAFIQATFLRILSRQPSAAEFAASRQFLADQTGLLAREAAGTTVQTSDDKLAKIPPRPKDPAARAREDFVHALFNHNDFVTIR